MDIEGAELDVIEDLANRNRLKLIREAIIEYHHHIRKEDDSLSELLKILESHGFGYQIRSKFALPYEKGISQNIMVYAYQKPLGV